MGRKLLRRRFVRKRFTVSVMVLLLSVTAVFAQAAGERESTSADRSITLYCYDTFSSEWGSGPTLIPLFEEETGIKVNVVSTGDAVEMLSRAIMEGENCQADLIMGISDDQAAKAYESGLFEPYESPVLSDIDDSLEFDSQHRLIPFDYGVFAFVWDSESDTPAPESLEDLKDPVYKDKIILIDPRTSSVGLGLLLWTIDVYGEDGYLDWWKAVKENALTIADGWSSAYGLFTEGEAPLVISYTTSPVYHVMSENTTRYQALIFPEGHHSTIESIGLVATSQHKEEAKAFIDFILTEGQKDTAIANSMYPVNSKTELPDAYDWAPVPETVFSMDPETVGANIDRWTTEWTQAMIGE